MAKSVLIKFEPELLAAVKKKAAKEGSSLSAVVKQLLRAWLNWPYMKTEIPHDFKVVKTD